MPPKPNKLQPALVGGVTIGVISAVPFLNLINCFCCAGVLLGGFLAVMIYKNNITPGMAPLTSNDAIAVGALAGLFGAVIATVLGGMILALFGNVTGEMIYDFMIKSGVEVPEELYDELRESLVEETLGFGWLMMSLFVGAIVDTLFGLLGGLIGFAVFKPKTPPVAPAVPPPAVPAM